MFSNVRRVLSQCNTRLILLLDFVILSSAMFHLKGFKFRGYLIIMSVEILTRTLYKLWALLLGTNKLHNIPTPLRSTSARVPLYQHASQHVTMLHLSPFLNKNMNNKLITTTFLCVPIQSNQLFSFEALRGYLLSSTAFSCSQELSIYRGIAP